MRSQESVSCQAIATPRRFDVARTALKVSQNNATKRQTHRLSWTDIGRTEASQSIGDHNVAHEIGLGAPSEYGGSPDLTKTSKLK
jgi:hypothetical protein